MYPLRCLRAPIWYRCAPSSSPPPSPSSSGRLQSAEEEHQYMSSCFILSAAGVSGDECICRSKRPLRLGSSMHGPRSCPLGFLSPAPLLPLGVDALGHRGHHPSPGSPIHLSTPHSHQPFSHSLHSAKSHHPSPTWEGKRSQIPLPLLLPILMV